MKDKSLSTTAKNVKIITAGGTVTLRSTVAGSNGATNYSALNFTLQLNGGAGANTFTINSWSGTTPLAIDGKDGGDTVKVILNGKAVIPGAKLPDLPAKGPVVLQHHGGKRDGKWNSPPALVQFRNIQIKELK